MERRNSNLSSFMCYCIFCFSLLNGMFCSTARGFPKIDQKALKESHRQSWPLGVDCHVSHGASLGCIWYGLTICFKKIL